MMTLKDVIDGASIAQCFVETDALLQINTVGEFGFIVNVFSMNEAALKNLADILRANPIIDGPTNCIGTPALTLYLAKEKSATDG